jgi:hypothetical protein
LVLQSLLEFLTAAPKTYVIKLHRKERPGEGLMQATKVNQLVYDWAMAPERLRKLLHEVEAPGRYLLGLIYVSGDRGAAEEELLSAQESLQPSQAAMLLGKLEQELVIHSRQGDGPRTFHGFEEMAALLLPEALKDQWVAGPGWESANWISHRHFLSSHLCHFLCQVALGEIKVTQTGEMHRKDQQELSQRFAFGDRLSSSIPAEEVQFLLRFASQSRLVLQEEGRLYLADEGKALLKGDRAEAEAAILEWWTKTRARGIIPALQAFAALPALMTADGSPESRGTGGVSRVAPWANVFWIFSGTQRKSYQDHKTIFTWENLPKMLQEIWLLGLAEFGMNKGRIAWIRPAAATAARAPIEAQASRPISLPNLESLVPLDSPLAWQRRLELVGRKSNDEFMARYRFTKESVIQGLQTGLTMEEFKELLTWLAFEGPACRTLLDWASTYASTLFVDSLVLKVSDPDRFRELEEIPQFLELVTEIIPGYGFALPRQNKGRVKELLQHFGLVPGEDVRRVPHLEPVVLDPTVGGWDLPSPHVGPPAYRENPLAQRTAPPPPSDKTQGSREQELAQRIETLEEAITQEKKVEFSFHGPVPKRIVVKPLLLLKQKAPIKLIGIENDTGHRNEYLLEQVKSLRIME